MMQFPRLVFLPALLCLPLAAQESRGSLSGTITDSTGAVIASAPLKLSNVDTGVSFASTTNEAGQYRFLLLNPGNYTLTAEVPGFRRYERTGIVLQVAQAANVDVSLQVGSQTETISVTGTPPLLDTDKADRGMVVDRTRISELPLNNRTPIMLSSLSPGVLHSGSSQHLVPYANSGLGAWSINGSTPRNVEFLMDGAPNNMIYGGSNSISYVPSAETVEEFKIITGSYDAQYGRTGGGVISVVSKSGTNQIHGSMYEFMKRTFLNANTFSNNSQKAPRTGSTLDQYGVTVGGPVVLPKVYNGRDKTFFFWGWERFGYTQQFPSESFASVPTIDQRRGDFSRTFDTANRQIVIYDPLTGRLEGNNWVRSPFNGNVIPSNRIDPSASKILTLYPEPNTTTPGAPLWQNNYFRANNTGRFEYNNYSARIDHLISSKHRIYGRWSYFPEFETRVINALPGIAGDLRAGDKISNNGVVDWVSTLTPTTVFNVRTSFNRWLENKDPSRYPGGTDGWTNATQLGWPAAFVNQLPDPGRVPRIEPELYGPIGTASGQTNFEPTNTLSVHPNFSFIRGKHTVKTGLDFRMVRYARQVSAYAGAQLTFDRGFTRRDYLNQDALSGNSVASMLLGYASGGTIDNNVKPLWQWLYYAPWVQDDIRVTRKLTVNLGLRWDLNTPPTERFDRMNRGFLADQVNPISSRIDQRAFPGYKVFGGLAFAGKDGQPRAAYETDYKTIQPRAGAAYQLNDKTVVRGGYGLYFLNPTSIGRNFGFSITTPFVATLDAGRTPASRLSDPFPSGVVQPLGAALGMETLLGQSPTFADPGGRVPSVHSFSFGIQRQLPGQILVDAAYVGSRARQLRTSRPFNELSLRDLALGDSTKGGDPNFLNARINNPFANLLPGTSINAATVPRQQLLRPYPQFGAFNVEDLSDGNVWYNSFQLSVQKRYTHGLTLTAALTLAKNVEALTYLNGQDAAPTRSLAAFDRSYRLVIAPIYELPFGPGRKFLSSKHWFNRYVAGGWQVVVNTAFQSGEPMQMPANTYLLRDPRLDNPTYDRLFKTGYIDVDGRVRGTVGSEEPVWQIRPPFTLRTTPLRHGNLRNRWGTTADFTLAKAIPIRERARLQIRAEAFNALNTPVFSQQPNLTVTSPNFGAILRNNGQTNEPRVVQLAARLTF